MSLTLNFFVKWLSNGAARLSNGAAWLNMVLGGSVGSASVAVKHARVRFSARRHREVYPTEYKYTSDEEMDRMVTGRINVLYEYMYVKINKKSSIHRHQTFKS